MEGLSQRINLLSMCVHVGKKKKFSKSLVYSEGGPGGKLKRKGFIFWGELMSSVCFVAI